MSRKDAGLSSSPARPIGRVVIGVLAFFVLFELLLWIVGALTH